MSYLFGKNMRPAQVFCFLLSNCLLFACHRDSTDVEGHTYYVYYLGGQSNMEGYGYNAELPADWELPTPPVMIFQGSPGIDGGPVAGPGRWEPLRPGHGTGFSSNGRRNKHSRHFGPELAFGKRMAELRPRERIAILKYAKGGSSLEATASPYGCWEPDFAEGNGINQYDHFLAAVRNAFAVSDIDGDGAADRLVPAGIVWMQGEADANHTAETALRYEANLKRLIDLMRAVFRTDDLPAAIGKIKDSGMDEVDGKMMDHIETVQLAQQNFCDEDPHATLVRITEGFGFLPDKWHYQSSDLLRLGEEFANAIHSLGEKAGK